MKQLTEPKQAALAAVAGLLAVTALVAVIHAATRPAGHTGDPVSKIEETVKASAQRLTTQEETLAEWKRLDAERITAVTERIDRLATTVDAVTAKIDNAANVSQNTAAQIQQLQGRLSRIETSLARLDADLHTPQILQQTLDKQKGLARP